MAVPKIDTGAWTRTLDLAKSAYGIELKPDGNLPGEVPVSGKVTGDAPNLSLTDAAQGAPIVPSISNGFEFIAEPADELSFRYYHVEPLLQEVVALAARILADRTTYQRLGAEFIRYRLQIEEFVWLDAIHSLERPDVYKLPHEEAAGELDAEQSLAQSDTELVAKLENIFSAYQSSKQSIINHEAGAAWNGSLPFYAEAGLPVQLRTFDPNTGSIAAPPGSGSGQDVMAAMIERVLSTFAVEISTQLAEIESLKQKAAETARQKRLQGLQFKEGYLKRNIDYRTLRTQVSEAIIRRKILELARPDGAMNYSEQMIKIRARVAADLREIYARATAINKGLGLIFGIKVQLPNPESAFFLDEIVTWTRAVQNKLSRFTRIDQNYVYSVSLASIFGPKNFIELTGSKWQFTLQAEDFPGQLSVRIRGLSAYAEDAADGVYRLEVQPPIKAKVVLRGEGASELDQTSVPKCYLGRVQSRQSPRDADVTGTEALYNCSPLGEWTIRLDPKIVAIAMENKLRDIVLNIFLAFQPTGEVL